MGGGDVERTVKRDDGHRINGTKYVCFNSFKQDNKYLKKLKPAGVVVDVVRI